MNQRAYPHLVAWVGGIGLGKGVLGVVVDVSVAPPAGTHLAVIDMSGAGSHAESKEAAT